MSPLKPQTLYVPQYLSVLSSPADSCVPREITAFGARAVFAAGIFPFFFLKSE